jgi:Alginate export
MNMDPTPMQRETLREDALGRKSSGSSEMKKTATIVLLLAGATPALADDVKIKPIVDARLRYENVYQAGVPKEADAITLRMRAGFEAKTKLIAVLVEAEGVLAISERYNSGLNGKTLYPVVADPQNVELNRAQIQLLALPKTVVTLGRQRINLDDQRFVGSVGWRQNEQTFDAARIEWTGVKNVKADVTYAWSDRTIWGVDGFGARQQAVSGDNVFANLSYKHKYGSVTGFAYLVDQDEAAVQAFRLSSKTFGVRATAALPIGGKNKLNLTASYAKQSDHKRNPNTYAASYFMGEAMADVSGFKLTAGYEVLGADNGIALTSFQTPLATLHKFNGWADKFLTTPPNGLRDLSFGAGYAFTKVKKLPGLNAQVMWHQYKSDRLSLDYGTEWNAQIGWKIGKKASFLAKYAKYGRKGIADFAGDANTQKLWAQLDYSL